MKMNLTLLDSGHEREIARLSELRDVLTEFPQIEERVAHLEDTEAVQSFLETSTILHDWLRSIPRRQSYVVYAVIALGQGPVIFSMPVHFENAKEHLQELLEYLWIVEDFYTPIGGIIGYQILFLELLRDHKRPEVSCETDTRYLQPPYLDMREDSLPLRQAVFEGIANMESCGEWYPIGGAGDRLGLKDERTDIPLPAALLCYKGKTLLESLIEDLDAREYLFYKIFNKQVCVPIALMTSNEKNNDFHIRELVKSKEWFHRAKNSIFFFTQPLAPVINEEGDWVMEIPLVPLTKPGGHGALWKLAQQKGIFDAFERLGCPHILIRQINNPLAGTDQNLLALMGLGISQDKTFGFMSCQRLVKSAQGVNVLIEKKVGNTYEHCISNIEYTDFIKKGIYDRPSFPGSTYSAFPANTNILFANLTKLAPEVTKNPLPGALINLKQCAPNREGSQMLPAGRIETTMQNIADTLSESSKPENLSKTFVVFNERRKTLSVTKNLYHPENSETGTPEAAYYDQMLNAAELLKAHCHFEIPRSPTFKEFISAGPSLVFNIHPALGPLFSIIAQKLQRGFLALNSELELDIAELLCHDLHLDGSLRILARNPLGRNEQQRYSNDGGKCHLKQVRVNNTGILPEQPIMTYWKKTFMRKESLTIILHGNGEFFAKNVCFSGNMTIEVPSGRRIEALQDGDNIFLKNSPLEKGPSWFWKIEKDSRYYLKCKKVQPPSLLGN